MLSYRHAFHAGNHADVLKHCVLLQLLRHLNLKDKPYWVVDTHAGAGRYRLDSEQAKKNSEFAAGIGRIWQADGLPPALADYIDIVRSFNDDGRLRHYPGSPSLALQVMRASDRLHLFELHGSDYQALGRTLAGEARRVSMHQADGFLGLKSVLPPPPRRGLVLIDPAYEDKRDYMRVVATVKEGLARFATGTFAVWYPQLQRGDARQLPERLRRLSDKWLDARLTVATPAADGFGMHGSGMFVINPPWTLTESLAEVLPWLADHLGVDEGASWLLESMPAAAAAARP
jgi:23S rRNA (adenine2030-N6)-methyltransferase